MIGGKITREILLTTIQRTAKMSKLHTQTSQHIKTEICPDYLHGILVMNRIPEHPSIPQYLGAM